MTWQQIDEVTPEGDGYLLSYNRISFKIVADFIAYRNACGDDKPTNFTVRLFPEGKVPWDEAAVTVRILEDGKLEWSEAAVRKRLSKTGLVLRNFHYAGHDHWVVTSFCHCRKLSSKNNYFEWGFWARPATMTDITLDDFGHILGKN